MKRVSIMLSAILLLLGLTKSVSASEPELNQTLVRVINQINAILPLLDEAKEEVKPDSRIMFQVESFIGADGKKHPGLRDDLLSIRNSLIAFINAPALEPKNIKPLALDYVGRG